MARRLIAIFFFTAWTVFGSGQLLKREDKPKLRPISEIHIAKGESLDYLGSFRGERDAEGPRRTEQVITLLAGPAAPNQMNQPKFLAVDSKGRVLVSDPGARAIHVFDFEQNKYLRIEGKGHRLEKPGAIATDAQDNIYVIDVKSALILVYDANGGFKHYIGKVRGEGSDYERPTGLAIDRKTGRMYLTDAPRHYVFVLDLDGHVLDRFGVRGGGGAPGQFNYPTQIVLSGDELFVLDMKNLRIQVLGLDGKFHRQVHVVGALQYSPDRAMQMGVDSLGHVYLADEASDALALSKPNGDLFYSLEGNGGKNGEFRSPAGVWIDKKDRIYVSDSRNHRVQIFQYRHATPVSESAASSAYHAATGSDGP